MVGKSIFRTFALLTVLSIIPIGAQSAIKAAGNGDPPAAMSGVPSLAPAGVPRAAANASESVSLVEYEFVPFDAATDTAPLLNRLVQSGSAIWDFPPFIPDPAPLAIFGLGLLAVGFLRLFRSAR